MARRKKKKKKIAKRRAIRNNSRRCSHVLASGKKCKKYAVKNGKCDLHAEAELSAPLKSELAKYIRSRLPRRKRRRNPSASRCAATTNAGKRCRNKVLAKFCRVHRRRKRKNQRRKKY